jgi:hypothetical protein
MINIIKEDLKIFIEKDKNITNFIEFAMKKNGLTKSEVLDVLSSLRLKLQKFVPVNYSFINVYLKQRKHRSFTKKMSELSKEEYDNYKKSQISKEKQELSCDLFYKLFTYEDLRIKHDNKVKIVCEKMREKYSQK